MTSLNIPVPIPSVTTETRRRSFKDRLRIGHSAGVRKEVLKLAGILMMHCMTNGVVFACLCFALLRVFYL